MTEWYTEEGKTGELEIEHRNGNWYVSNPPEEEEIRCILENDDLIADTNTEQCIEATVSSFRRGIDGSPSYLFLMSSETVGEPASGSSEQQSERRHSTPDKETTSNSRWELSEFRGSGEYVDVEATIDSVFFVKKDVRGVPDIKGELTDESVLNPVTFIIEEGTSHPYLEEGKEFLFRNVKDHFYKKQAEVQVVISDNTDFVDK